MATRGTNTPSAPPSTPFADCDHTAKRPPPTTPFADCDHPAKRPRTHQPREWVQSEERITLNRYFSYAECWGATTDYCWKCPEEDTCGAVWTLYPTSTSCRSATGIRECCHHPRGSVRLSFPHQCSTCFTEWKPCRALPGVDHPAFAKARGSHTSSK